jgi:hypothetical protein
MKKLSYLLAILLIACVNPAKKANNPPIAKVYDSYLYRSQLEEIVPKGLNFDDSIQVAKDHIDKWIRNQLLLYQANLNLTEEDKNVDRQIEDYRSSLLIFKYEQNYISQKLDTLVPDNEIEKYYNEYSSNFILSNNLLKGIFLRVPRSAPQVWRVRSWVRSDNPEDLKNLEEYCFSNAAIFDYFDEDWRPVNEVMKEMPTIYTSPERLLRSWKLYEVRDSTYNYFLKISDYRLEGAVTPLELVREDIRSILLNKRKIRLIQELEANIYNDALNRGNFVVYD